MRQGQQVCKSPRAGAPIRLVPDGYLPTTWATLRQDKQPGQVVPGNFLQVCHASLSLLCPGSLGTAHWLSLDSDPRTSNDLSKPSSILYSVLEGIGLKGERQDLAPGGLSPECIPEQKNQTQSPPYPPSPWNSFPSLKAFCSSELAKTEP